jgi:hypothetical protein
MPALMLVTKPPHEINAMVVRMVATEKRRRQGVSVETGWERVPNRPMFIARRGSLHRYYRV